jgi:hypothetical protein
MIIIRLLDILLRIAALSATLFLSYAYSTSLDSFPWGRNSAYMFWVLLLYYFILPAFFIYGVIRFFHGVLTHAATKERIYLTSAPLFLFITFLLIIPVWMGIEAETDIKGRWTGVLTSLLSATLIVPDLKRGAQAFWDKKQ